MPLAALYLRMSDDKQETSIVDQRTECRAYAKRHGLKIVCEFIDEGISGDETAKRTAFQRMIAEAGSGKWQVILCWDMDRFGRFDALEAGFWIQPLRNAGVVLETVAQGRIDWTEFAGRIMYSIQAEAKHAYLRDLSRNVNRGMLSAARNGRWLSDPPTGYVIKNDECLIDRERAELVRRIFADYLIGKSTNAIARELNEEGVAPPRAKSWSGGTVLGILKNEAYLGIYRWNRTTQAKYSQVRNGQVVPVRNKEHWKKDAEDMIVIEDHHPAIIDKRTFDAAQVMRGRNRRETGPKKWSGPFALRGLLRCGACGSPMHGRRRDYGAREPFYVCSLSLHSSKCRTNAVRQAELVETIMKLILHKFLRRGYAKELEKRLLARMEKQREDDRPAVLEKRLATIRGKIDRAKSRLIECDRDMLPIVQDQLRTLIEQERSIASAVSSLGKSAKKPVTDHRSEVARMAKTVRHLERNAKSMSPVDLRQHLVKLIDQITVHVREEKVGQRCYFRLDSIQTEFKVGLQLQTQARHRTCASSRS